MLGDLDDVVQLVLANALTWIRWSGSRFLKSTATKDSMKKCDTPAEPVEALPPREPAESSPSLDLPEAPDFVSRPSRIPLERMIPLMEQYRRWFPPTEATVAQRAKRKCGVEFVL